MLADLVKSVRTLGVVEEEVGDGLVEGLGEGVEGAESRGVGSIQSQGQGEQGVLSMVEEDRHEVCVAYQQVGNQAGSGIPYDKPDHFWRMTSKKAHLAKIVVFGHDDETVLGRVVPNGCIGLTVQINVIDAGRPREGFL